MTLLDLYPAVGLAERPAVTITRIASSAAMAIPLTNAGRRAAVVSRKNPKQIVHASVLSIGKSPTVLIGQDLTKRVADVWRTLCAIQNADFFRT